MVERDFCTLDMDRRGSHLEAMMLEDNFFDKARKMILKAFGVGPAGLREGSTSSGAGGGPATAAEIEAKQKIKVKMPKRPKKKAMESSVHGGLWLDGDLDSVTDLPNSSSTSEDVTDLSAHTAVAVDAADAADAAPAPALASTPTSERKAEVEVKVMEDEVGWLIWRFVLLCCAWKGGISYFVLCFYSGRRGTRGWAGLGWRWH
ncbi:unnamed protein product [Choristocarpus tenellus]